MEGETGATDVWAQGGKVRACKFNELALDNFFLLNSSPIFAQLFAL